MSSILFFVKHEQPPASLLCEADAPLPGSNSFRHLSDSPRLLPRKIHPFPRIRLQVREPRTGRRRLAGKLWRIENELPVADANGTLRFMTPEQGIVQPRSAAQQRPDVPPIHFQRGGFAVRGHTG